MVHGHGKGRRSQSGWPDAEMATAFIGGGNSNIGAGSGDIGGGTRDDEDESVAVPGNNFRSQS